MDAKQTFLQVFEKLEGFAHRLPGALQTPILQEVTPLKDLFLRQRAPRLVLAGDPGASSAGLFNAIFGAPVAPFAREDASDKAPPAAGWQDFSHAGRGVLRLLEARQGEEVSEATAAALAAEPPDLFLFLVAPGAMTANDPAAFDRLEALLERTERAHGLRPCVVGIVVDANEAPATDDTSTSDKARLQAALAARPRIAQHLAPAQSVRTFMRFRLDGTFDPDSDRRRGVADLVDALVAELPNEARVEMARLSGARAAQAKIAGTLVKSFTAVSGALGAQPIPLADMPFLIGFQLAMVAGIIYVSGRELSLKLATEFLGTMGMNMGLGLVFREGARAAARAATKLFLPGIGNAVSGLVAAGGTYAIGRAATAYYIEGVNLAEARELLRRSRKSGGVSALLGRRSKKLPPPDPRLDS